MFSSNQILSVSCDICEEDISRLLRFAFQLSEYGESFSREKNPLVCTYQVTDDGKVCIGWAANPVNLVGVPMGHHRMPEGWEQFDFGYNIKKIARFIEEKLVRKGNPRGGKGQGMYKKGCVMKVIPDSMNNGNTNIKSPFYGIVYFKSYTTYYAMQEDKVWG